jgi:hypothetical protein
MFVTLDSSITKDRLIDYGRIANKVERQLEPELPDISWYNIPKRGNIYQINIKYGKWPQNIPIFSIARPSKLTQIGIFGLKIFRLATLIRPLPCSLLLAIVKSSLSSSLRPVALAAKAI